MPAAIVAERLTKTYQVKVRDAGLGGAVRALVRPRYREVRAVEAISFQVERGEIVAFLGPNGAGKTTTLKMLTGLLYPTAGRAHVAGFTPWDGGSAFKRRIALVLPRRPFSSIRPSTPSPRPNSGPGATSWSRCSTSRR